MKGDRGGGNHGPMDRQGIFYAAVMPKDCQYEDTTAHDLSLMFLAGLSSRNFANSPGAHWAARSLTLRSVMPIK
jgi:hypothetical protein